MVAILWPMGKEGKGVTRFLFPPTLSRSTFPLPLSPFPHTSTFLAKLIRNHGCVTSTTSPRRLLWCGVAENNDSIQSVLFLSLALVQDSWERSSLHPS